MKANKLVIAFIVVLLIIPLTFLILNWGRGYFYPLKYRKVIASNARLNHVDPYLVAAIIYEESRFRSEARSQVGAVGLMQVMPDTAKWIAQKTGRQYNRETLSGPENNIAMGVWYYAWLRKKYKSEQLALAAYNSGDKNLDKWLRLHPSGSDDDMIDSIPFRETREFVRRVRASKERYQRLYPDAFMNY